MLLSSSPGCTPPLDPAASGAIRQVLLDQEAAWNAGDVRAYMAGYWASDSLRFASGDAVQYGWQTTLDRYLRSYPDRAAMGRLTFSEIDVQVLTHDTALAFGRWQLQRTGDYADIGGLFTLVFRKFDAGWRITYDHTSSGS